MSNFLKEIAGAFMVMMGAIIIIGGFRIGGFIGIVTSLCGIYVICAIFWNDIFKHVIIHRKIRKRKKKK